MRKYLIVLACLFWVQSMSAYSFQDLSDESELSELKTVVLRNQPKEIIHYTTALSDSLKNHGLDDSKIYFWVLFYMGEGLELDDQFVEAIQLYHSIIEDCNKRQYFDISAESYLSLARVYEYISRPVDCRRNLRLAQALINKHRFEAIRSRYYIRSSSYFRIYNQLDSAKYYAKLGLELGLKYGVSRSIVDGELLNGLLKEGFSEKIEHLQNAEKIFLERMDFAGAIAMSTNIAKISIQNKNIGVGAAALNRSMVYIKEIEEDNYVHKYTILRVYDFKQQLAELQGNFEEAYDFSKKMNVIYKTMNQVFDQQAINELETNFAIEQEQEKSKYSRLIILILSVSFAVTVILLFALISYLRKLRKTNETISKQNNIIAKNVSKLEESNQQKQILLSEIHHRVKNNLQLVISLLELHGQKFENEEFNEQLQSISNKVMSIALLHDQLYLNDDLNKINLEDYLLRIKDIYMNLGSSTEILKIKIKSRNILINLPSTFPIGIIITELINNSLKYAKTNGNRLIIDIQITKLESEFVLIYRDNGNGYLDGSLSNQNGTIGSLLINSMVRQLQAKHRTFNDKGAVFELKFREKTTSTV